MKVKLYSKLPIDECIRILQQNIKQFPDFDEYRGDVNGNEFRLQRCSWETLGMWFNHPQFNGTLVKQDSGTIIDGSFTDQRFRKLFDHFSIRFTFIVGILVCLSLIKPGSFKSNALALVVGITLIVWFSLVKKFIKKQYSKDRKTICNFLMTKLEAVDIQGSVPHNIT